MAVNEWTRRSFVSALAWTVEKLAKATGLSKTALVERAVDRLQRESRPVSSDRLQALLAQLDRVPDRADAHDPLSWDALGLPQ